ETQIADAIPRGRPRRAALMENELFVMTRSRRPAHMQGTVPIAPVGIEVLVGRRRCADARAHPSEATRARTLTRPYPCLQDAPIDCVARIRARLGFERRALQQQGRVETSRSDRRLRGSLDRAVIDVQDDCRSSRISCEDR